MKPVEITIIGYVEGQPQKATLKSPLSAKTVEYVLPADSGYFGFGPVSLEIPEGDQRFRVWLCRGKAVNVRCEYPVPDREIRAHIEQFISRLEHRRDPRGQGTGAERADASPERARIPERVRSYVWRRDGGRCVQCGSSTRLEFDHIVPVAEGGGSTERNIQLLCESCNRRKGKTI